ncbi:MAG: MBOAT family O-acyltransferase [Bacteroidia bacterium]
MLFNALEFWIFLPVVWLLYFSIPSKIRWVWLLCASYFFYGFWKIEFAGLMLITSLMDWYSAKRVHAASKIFWKRFWMWFAISTDLFILFVFKYFDFAFGKSELAYSLYHNNSTAWIIELGKYTIPAGISFYTFQSISYVVDVYRGNEEPEKNPIKFMLFVSFFPQLVAGPIERFGRLHQQLFQKYSPKLEDLKNGGRLLLYGLFLKVAIADNLAGVVDTFYSNPADYSVSSAWLAALLFTFQVYYDFFGYSLLAQGAALLFGIKLMDNFNKPFIAQSVPEFWHRWHISLSTWFRDYIFIPVGGNQKGAMRLAFGVLLVFFTSGLWHGANSTMIYFGLSQGVLYLFDRFIFKKTLANFKIGIFFRQLKTGFFFMMTLVFFRSQSIDQSTGIYSMLFDINGKHAKTASETMVTTYNFDEAGKAISSNYGPKVLENLSAEFAIWLFLLIGFLLDHLIMKSRADSWFASLPVLIRWAIYLFMLVAVLLFGGAVNHPFVYFQF